jgi:hypothetical protein
MQELTQEERLKLMAENKCFYCKKPGHVSRNCRSRGNTTQQNTPRNNQGQFQPHNQQQGGSNRGSAQPQRRPQQAHQAKIEEVVDDRDQENEEPKQADAPPAYDTEKLEAQVRAMNTEDRMRLMEKFASMEGF